MNLAPVSPLVERQIIATFRWKYPTIIPSGKPTLRQMLKDVCREYGVKPEDLTGDRRHHLIIVPRQAFMARAYATGRFSLSQIGYFLGGRDHSTVHSGIRAHKARSVR